MTTTPGPRSARTCSRRPMCARRPNIEGGFAGIFGTIAGAYFQKYGDQSDALALIAAKNHKNGVGNPFAQMRKDLGYEFCRTREREEPLRGGPAQAHRLLARLRRRRRGRAGRCRDRAAADARRWRSAPRSTCRTSCRWQARHPQVRGLRAGLAARAGERRHRARRPVAGRDARLFHHRRADRIRGDGSGAARGRAPAPSRRA